VLPYKYIVAQVIIDKNPRVKTVVNKIASIATEFRTFPLEVLAGEDDLVVELKEGGASFKFDFRNVYWNSRLQFEHTRLSDLIAMTSPSYASSTPNQNANVGSKRAAAEGEESEVGELKKQFKATKSTTKTVSCSSPFSAKDNGVIVADLMGGVGPFAIPLAQRGCIVHANDLNPESYKWLVHNASLNHVQNRVHCNNGDAREFVAKLRGRNFKNAAVSNDSSSSSSSTTTGIYSLASSCGEGQHEVVWFHHAIMNLPQTAIEFLDAFQGYLYTGKDCVKHEVDDNNEEKVNHHVLPMIHVYCFEKETDGTSESAALAAIQRCRDVLEYHLRREEVDVHVVRYVSPQKPMLCLSFRLPLEVASRTPKY
jgi:tRNA (guanine37-N1)-methyltransferase